MGIMAIKRIKYGNFLYRHGNVVIVTNDSGQAYDLIRNGISEDEVKRLVKENGREPAIRSLIEDGKLLPIYGGEIKL